MVPFGKQQEILRDLFDVNKSSAFGAEGKLRAWLSPTTAATIFRLSVSKLTTSFWGICPRRLFGNLP